MPWLVVGWNPQTPQYIVHDHHIKEGQQQGILLFNANWDVDGDGGVARTPGYQVEKSGTGLEIVRAAMNDEALLNIMNMVYLGAEANITLSGKDPVEMTVAYLRQQKPSLCATLRQQSPNDGTRPHQDVLNLREALAKERYMTAQALGAGGARKRNQEDSENDNTTEPVANLTTGEVSKYDAEMLNENVETFIAKKVRGCAGPVKERAAHAQQLRQHNDMQKSNVRKLTNALFHGIFGPLTEQCAQHESSPSALSLIPIKNLDDLPPAVFSKNPVALMSTLTPQQKEMCDKVIVSDVVNDLHPTSTLTTAGSRRAGVVVLSGDICLPNGNVQNIHDFMSNPSVRDIMREQLSQYFDSGVTFKNTDRRASSTRGHSTVHRLMLNLSWAAK